MSDISFDFPWWFVPVVVYCAPGLILAHLTGLARRYEVNAPKWFTALLPIASTAFWAGLAWLIFW